MTLNSSNYRQTHFEIKTPINISGEPTFDQLKKLFSQLKINAQCIHSSRGGGNHGHLGLVLSPVDYQQLTLTPFIRPVDPGDFVLPTNINLTMDQITVLKENHKSLRSQFEKVDAVEAALKQFLVEALDADFLLEIRNSTTERLEGTIPHIMTRLFRSYGNLTAKELLKKQQTLTNYTYDPHQPIDILFQVAQDYQDYSTFHGTPQPPTTIITTVYEVLRRTTQFQRALEDWTARPDNTKTWDNFKVAIRIASQNLREHAPDTTAQAGFANQVVEDITQGVANMLQPSDEANDQAQQFLQNLTDAVNQNQQAFTHMNDHLNNLQNEVQSMNAARGAATQNPNPNRAVRFRHPNNLPYTDINQAYMQTPLMSSAGNPQMPSMPYTMPPPPNYNQQTYPPAPSQPPTLFQQLNPTFNSRRSRNNNHRSNNNNRNGNNNHNPTWNNTQQWTNNTSNRGSGRGNGGRANARRSHYCWTHGSGAHPSDQCNTPSSGHQWNSTFRNRMGGNNEGCWN